MQDLELFYRLTESILWNNHSLIDLLGWYPLYQSNSLNISSWVGPLRTFFIVSL